MYRVHGWCSVWQAEAISTHCCSTSCLCVRCRDEWNGACPYICLLYSPRPPLGYGLSRPSRRADLLADGVDCTLLPVKARGTISALYTITCQLCSYLQIGVHFALGLMFHFALVSDSNLRLCKSLWPLILIGAVPQLHMLLLELADHQRGWLFLCLFACLLVACRSLNVPALAYVFIESNIGAVLIAGLFLQHIGCPGPFRHLIVLSLSRQIDAKM